MKEIELKLLLTPHIAQRLRSAPALRALGQGGAITATLLTVYFDTEGQALAAAGIALRMRREGAIWTQTVKTARKLRGGLAEAEEHSIPATLPEPDIAAIPDPAVRARVAELVAGRPLAPVHATEVQRTTRRLIVPGKGEVEFALDVGEIRANGQAAPICEAEFELVSGSVQAVFEAARRVFPDGGLHFSTLTKAARGRLLAEAGTIEPPLTPRNARPVALDPSWTAEMAARETLAECFGQITENLCVVAGSDDPEGPHQLRIGLRRLRSAFLLFRPAIESETIAHLDTEARWLSHEAGVLRDLDVVALDILGPEMAAPGADPGFAALLETVNRRRATTRMMLRHTAKSPRLHKFLFDLAEVSAARLWLDPGDYAQTGRLGQPIGMAARAALDLRFDKSARRAKGIDHLGVDARHALRRELKKLRYACEFLAPLYPEKSVKPFVKRLKVLQEILGHLNDAAMAEALFYDPHGPAMGSFEAARAAGRIVGVRSERARASWEHAKAAWKALRAAEKFWH